MMDVYFTIDTETSMGGAWSDPRRRPLPADEMIFCRIGAIDYGVGFISRLLARHGFRGTFFVEPLFSLVNSDAETGRVFEFLLNQKQDVQLHLHPTFRFYAHALEARARGTSYVPPAASDLLSAFDEERQSELVGEAVALYTRFTGRAPSAFRAGCFAASQTTLRALHRSGVLFDSSFNPCYRGWSFPDDHMIVNEVRRLEGVWEIPISVATTPLPEGYGGFKHADPSAVSVDEIRTMLEHGASMGQRHFVILFHSFSAVKRQNGTSRAMKPDRLTIRRLERLFTYLSSRSDLFRVTTFGEAAASAETLEPGLAPVARLPTWSVGIRKAMQGLNRFYWF